MAQDPTSIANQALRRIGAKKIMDIEDDAEKGDKRAIVCRDFFEQCVREVGRDDQWNCLTDFEELGRANSEAPYNFKWDYGFYLPENFLRLNRLNGYDTNEQEDVYQLAGRILLTNADVAQVEFNRYTADTTKYDPMFVECIVVLLSSKIAIPIRQDEQLAQALRQEYERITLPKGRKVDGNERKKRTYSPTSESRWSASRTYSTVRSHPN